MPETFAARVISSASSGAVAAVVGAALGAVAEPVVNTVLTKRVSLGVALEEFNWQRAWKFFYEGTLPTNLIKFPFYGPYHFFLKSRMGLPQPPPAITTLHAPHANFE